MKRKITSVQKYNSPHYTTVQIHYNQSPCHGNHVHHKRCLLPENPKNSQAPRKLSIQNKPHRLNAIDEKGYANLKNLIVNVIDSADRVSFYVTAQEHTQALKLYFQDKEKLISYLNSLSSSNKLEKDQDKTDKRRLSNKKQQVQKYQLKNLENMNQGLMMQIKTLKENLNAHIQKYRSQSVAKNFQKRLKLDLQQIKRRTLRLQNHKYEKQQRIRNSFIYLQLLIFKVQQMLQQYAVVSQQTSTHVVIQKDNVQKLKAALDESLAHAKIQSSDIPLDSILKRMKTEAQQMMIKSVQMIKNQKQSTKKQRESSKQKVETVGKSQKTKHINQQQYQQLNTKIIKLHHEMGNMIQQVNNKDQFIDCLTVQNGLLKQEQKNMENYMKKIQIQKQQFSNYIAQVQEKTKLCEAIIEAKNQTINELVTQIQQLRVQLFEQGYQIQGKEKQFQQVKQEHKNNLNSKQEVISKLYQDKKTIEQDRLKSEKQLKSLQDNLKLIQSSKSQIQSSLKNAIEQQNSYKQNIQILQQKLCILQKQNNQLLTELGSGKKQQQLKNIQNENKQLVSKNKAQEKTIEGLQIKMKFYEQKLEQLLYLTNFTQYDNIIAQKDLRINQLQGILSEYPQDMKKALKKLNSFKQVYGIDPLTIDFNDQKWLKRFKKQIEQIKQMAEGKKQSDQIVFLQQQNLKLKQKLEQYSVQQNSKKAIMKESTKSVDSFLESSQNQANNLANKPRRQSSLQPQISTVKNLLIRINSQGLEEINQMQYDAQQEQRKSQVLSIKQQNSSIDMNVGRQNIELSTFNHANDSVQGDFESKIQNTNELYIPSKLRDDNFSQAASELLSVASKRVVFDKKSELKKNKLDDILEISQEQITVRKSKQRDISDLLMSDAVDRRKNGKNVDFDYVSVPIKNISKQQEQSAEDRLGNRSKMPEDFIEHKQPRTPKAQKRLSMNQNRVSNSKEMHKQFLSQNQQQKNYSNNKIPKNNVLLTNFPHQNKTRSQINGQ